MLKIKHFLGFLVGIVSLESLAIDNTKDPHAPPRVPKDSPRAARVRIPLEITNYEKLVVQSPDGQARIKYKSLPTQRHTLRARIERPNHFHVGSWHFETVPIKFDRTSMSYSFSLRIAKKYGTEWDMEESVGRMEITGTLKGQDFQYELLAHSDRSFKSPEGNPWVDIKVGQKPLSPLVQAKNPSQLSKK